MNKKSFTPLEMNPCAANRRLPKGNLSLTGFTLIELLVVIVIVGLLMAIFFPAFGRVRESARRALCINNLRQHGIAWYLYLEEHNDCFPERGIDLGQARSTSFGGKIDADGTWPANVRILNRYLEIYDDLSPNLELFHCPDDTIPSCYAETIYDHFGTSYYLGDWILGTGAPRSLSTVTSPRNKVLLEMCTPAIYPGHGGRLKTILAAPPYSPPINVMVLFVDGHVAGPYRYVHNAFFANDPDFEWYNPNTTKPVLCDPNGTMDDD